MKEINHIGIVGLGWLGMPLAKELSKKYHIMGTTTTASKLVEEPTFKSICYQAYQGEAQKLQALQSCEVVIITIPPKSPFYLQQIQETVNAFPTHVKFIFTSSIGVYEDQKEPITELSKRKNTSLTEVEDWLIEFLGNRLILLRLGGLVGEDRNPIHFLSGRLVPHGQAPVNFIHRKDILRAIDLLLEDQQHWGAIFNLVSHEHPSKQAYYTKMAKQMNLTPPTFEYTVLDRLIIGTKFERETKFQYNNSIWTF